MILMGERKKGEKWRFSVKVAEIMRDVLNGQVDRMLRIYNFQSLEEEKDEPLLHAQWLPATRLPKDSYTLQLTRQISISSLIASLLVTNTH